MKRLRNFSRTTEPKENAELRERLMLPRRDATFSKRNVDDGGRIDGKRRRLNENSVVDSHTLTAGPNPNRVRPLFSGLSAVDDALAGISPRSRRELSSNVVEISPDTIQRLSSTFDTSSREMAAFLLSQTLPISLSFDQAVDYAQLVLKDQFKLRTAISGEIAPLLDWVATCGLVSKAASMMTDIPASTRQFIIQEFISNIAQQVVSKLPISSMLSSTIKDRTMEGSPLLAVVKPGTKDAIFSARKFRKRSGRS